MNEDVVVFGGDVVETLNDERRQKTIYKGREVWMTLPKEKVGSNEPSRKERRRRAKHKH
jgi:hypothetical protein